MCRGLYLNIHFENGRLSCVTGTSFKTFTLDKTLEHVWDEYAERFFIHKGIDFEKRSEKSHKTGKGSGRLSTAPLPCFLPVRLHDFMYFVSSIIISLLLCSKCCHLFRAQRFVRQHCKIVKLPADNRNILASLMLHKGISQADGLRSAPVLPGFRT